MTRLSTFALIVAASLLCTVLPGQEPPLKTPVPTRVLREPAIEPVPAIVGQFSGRLFGAAAKSKPGQNFVISPFGAHEALSVLQHGARGTTAEELSQVVGAAKELAPAFARMRRSGFPFVDSLGVGVEANNEYGLKIAKDPPEGSAARRAGLRKGDLIFTVNDEPVRTPEAFAALCRKLRGQAVLSGYRLGEGTVFQSLEVTLDTAPALDTVPAERPIAFSRALWIDSDLAKKSPYASEVEKLFESQTFPLDGKTVEASASEFFREQTGGRIERVALQPLPENLQLLIVDVLAMNSEWARKFNPRSTHPGDFVTPERVVQTDYLSQQGTYALAQTEDGTKILEMPYRDSRLLFRVYLPAKPKDLAALESHLAANDLKLEFRREAVSIQLPKFRVESTHSLKDAVASLGAKSVFDRKAADLRGIDPEDGLVAADVRQQVYLEITERGTRAGSVTDIPVVLKGAPPRAVAFHARHPFVFEVRDTAGAVFLMGRVVEPLAPDGMK